MTLGAPSQSIIALMSIAAFAAILSWVAIHLGMPLLKNLALAHPVARSSHKTPTPQGAGVAIAFAAAVSTLAFVMIFPSGIMTEKLHVLMLVLALTVMIATGLMDDVYGLSIRIRLSIQFASAIAIIASMPVTISVLPVGWPIVIERTIEIGILLTFTNLVNFIDGLDEISIAHGVPALTSVSVIALSGALPSWIMPLAGASCGALIGFWPWNRHVAKIFLGDSGSLPLGLLLGYLMIVLAGSGYWSSAVLLCLYPLMDGTWTLFDRLRRGQNLTEGHRDHCYQRATSRGLSVPMVSRTVLALSGALAILAQLIGANGAVWPHVILAGVGFALTAATLRWLACGWRPLR